MKFSVCSFIIVFFNVSLSAQHDHDFLNDRMSKKSDVIYTIRADVDAHPGIVKGTLELEFTNPSDQAIEELTFSVLLNEFREGSKLANRYFLVDYDTLFTSDTSSGYINIDSISFLGATLGSEQYLIQDGYLNVKLPSPVEPGEKRYLFLSFESKIPVVIEERRFVRLFKDFFPKLVWFDSNIQYDFGWYENDFPYADFNVELNIEGDYYLSHPGELLNEKLIYDLPDTGNLWVNYAQFRDSSSGYRYAITSKKTRDFQFVVSNDNQRDRLSQEHYTIDAQYHPEQCKYDWAERTVVVADSLIKQLKETYGDFPYKKIELCAIDSTFLQFGTGQIIFIPDDVKKEYDMSLFILSELSKLYVPKIYSSIQAESYFSDGLASYITMQTAFERYQNDGFADLKRYEKRLRNKTKAYKLLEKDKKALDPLGHPITVTDDAMAADIENLPIYFHNSFRKIPAWLENVKCIAGDSVFNSALVHSLAKFRYQVISSNEFIADFSNNLNIDLLNEEYLHNLLTAVDSIDFALQNPHIEQKNDSSIITAEIISNTQTIIPLEIAFVGIRNDTLYKKIYPDEFQNQVYKLSETLNGKIKLIVLNPNYAHNELTRSNNYYSLTPQKFNMQEPGWFFLGFHPF